MSLKQFEEQKKLVNACREKFEQAKTDYAKTTNEINVLRRKLKKILDKKYNLNHEIYNLEQVIVAELDEKELANELKVLDGNSGSGSCYTGLNVNDFVENYPNGDDKAILKHKKHKIEQFNFDFDFKTQIYTNKIYELHSYYSTDELINGKPLIEYFKINFKEKTIDPRTVEVHFGFDRDFYDNHFKIRLSLAEMKKYPNLETAVMNILKRHEQTEGV